MSGHRCQMVRRHAVMTWIILTAIMQLVLVAVGMNPIVDGQLLDADSYSRLVRIEQMHREGVFSDSTDMRVNAPFGERLQWSRPLDVLIEGGALAITAVGVYYRDALFLAGAAVSPALQLVELVILYEWWRRRHPGPGAGYVLLASRLIASPALFTVFAVGYSDHHSLLAVIFLGQLATLSRLMDDISGRVPAGWALGLLGGLGVWVSLEAVVAQALFGVILVAMWTSGRIQGKDIA